MLRISDIKNESIDKLERFEITDENMGCNFVSFSSDKDYEYSIPTEETLDIFKEIIIEEGTSELLEKEFTMLLEKIRSNKNNDLINNKEEIKKYLAEEIISRYYFQEGRIKQRLKTIKI